MTFYSDQKFGVINRKWFGLTKKWGGDVAAGFTLGTTDATSIDHVAKWYPKGPIRLRKFGVKNLATITHASSDLIPARLRVNGSTETTTDIYPKSTASVVAPLTVASTTDFTNDVVDAGSYIGIRTATPRTDKGTAANTATALGTLAFFIDWSPEYSTDGKWDG